MDEREAIARIIDERAWGIRQYIVSDPDRDRLNKARRRADLPDEDSLVAPSFAKADAILALRQPAQPSAGVGEWRPIETAPKDGKAVLLICTDAYWPTAFEGWWIEDGQYGIKGDGWVHYALPEEKLSGGVRRWFPTHWMPKEALPAGPTGPATPSVSDDGEVRG